MRMTMVFPLTTQKHRKKKKNEMSERGNIFQGVKMEITSITKRSNNKSNQFSPSKWYDKNYVLPIAEWKRNKQQNDYDFN